MKGIVFNLVLCAIIAAGVYFGLVSGGQAAETYLKGVILSLFLIGPFLALMLLQYIWKKLSAHLDKKNDESQKQEQEEVKK